MPFEVIKKLSMLLNASLMLIATIVLIKFTTTIKDKDLSR